ncbi:hypothetical protein OXX80_010947 [Metschnikowia pulcherrima]
MAKLGKYTTKLTLPGEFIPRSTSPVRNKPVVVRLSSGERVKLLAPDKAPSRNRTSSNPWDSACRSIKTIPGTSHSLDAGFGYERRARSVIRVPDSPKEAASEKPAQAVSPIKKMTGSYDALSLHESIPGAESSSVVHTQTKGISETSKSPDQENGVPELEKTESKYAVNGTEPEEAEDLESCNIALPKTIPSPKAIGLESKALASDSNDEINRDRSNSGAISIAKSNFSFMPSPAGKNNSPHQIRTRTLSESPLRPDFAQPLNNIAHESESNLNVGDPLPADADVSGVAEPPESLPEDQVPPQSELPANAESPRMNHDLESPQMNLSLDLESPIDTPPAGIDILRDLDLSSNLDLIRDYEPPKLPEELTQDDPKVHIETSPGLLKSSAESNISQWLTSPQALISFSPGDMAEAQTRVQINYTISEVVQSEYAYVKSLSLLGNFFIEPLLMKCTGLKITCTPLLNMEVVIKSFRDKHERFLAHVSAEKDIDVLAREMTEVVSEPSYGRYAACAELLLYLVNVQTPPFVSSYIQNLQTFLERNQPGERRMDLSLSSLLQKPMGRIAKYRLFLGALAKLCPENGAISTAMARVNGRLAEINAEIHENKERQGVLESVALWLDLTDVPVPVYQFYGLINLLGSCTVLYLVPTRRGTPEPVLKECNLLLHDNHVILADAKFSKPLFVLSFDNCQMVAEASDSVGGLYSDDPLASKIVFELGNCQYEVMLISSTQAGHEAILRACAEMSPEPLEYDCLSDLDCYVGPSLAQFDLDLENSDALQGRSSTCYFRQVFRVDTNPAASRFNAMGRFFRGFSRQR